MKPSLLLLLIFALSSCNNQTHELKAIQSRIDSLEFKLADTYKPGFGEFMSGIQAHHSKLWFAGINSNWKLADFEVHEIMESVDDIQKYKADRKESQLINMIKPALDSVNIAIEQKNLDLFKSSFSVLTNTCNNCHQLSDFEFNKIKIPDTHAFSNQDFSVNESK